MCLITNVIVVIHVKFALNYLGVIHTLLNLIDENMQKSTAVYRSQDDINNLKIRINLREIGDESVVVERESKVFKWQQKVYGKFERDFYKDEKNCITDLEKKYHGEVINILHDDDILFTYVNEDEFLENEERPTELYKNVQNTRFLNDKIINSGITDGFDFNRSLNHSINNPYDYRCNFEAMRIMVDLGEFVDGTWLRSEYVLCTIKYDHLRQLFLIYPDFNNLDPYSIQTDVYTKRTFEYYIKDVSEKMPPDILLKENEIFNKVMLHQTKMRLQKIATNFELPPKNRLYVYLFFEILYAKNFEYNNIFLQYNIDLPENWFCTDTFRLQGTTPTSSSFSKDKLNYFGFPFEVCLEYDTLQFGSSKVIKPPHAYFEVISKDTWDRFRTEGLTYAILPISQPGSYDFELQCFRICSKGPYGNLKRFFIGDYSNCADVSWPSFPKDYDKNVINKYGVNTVSTGQINVRVKVVHQSQAFIPDFRNRASGKQETFILDKLNTFGLVKSIEQVVEAFKAAKRKMIEARKNI